MSFPFPSFDDKVLAVFAADSHLKPKLQNSRPLYGDSYESFDFAVQVAIRESAEWFLHGGDLLDAVLQGSDAPVFLAQEIDLLARASVRFGGVTGNHDAVDPPWFAVSRAAENLHGRVVEVGPYRIYCLNFQIAGRLQEELGELRRLDADALLCHQAWREISPPIATTHGSFADVPVVRVVLTGDLHKTILEEFYGADGQKMLVVSPGSGCIAAVNEPPDKYAVAILQDGSFSPFRLPTRVVHDVGRISTEGELEQLLDSAGPLIEELQSQAADLPERIRRPILRVTFNVEIPKVFSRLRRAFTPALYLFETPTSPRREQSRGTREAIRSKGSKIGFLARLREREGVGADTTRLLERLWEAENPAAELAAAEKEFFNEVVAEEES